ncbi:MAG: hypothetical protein PHN98_04860 [Smithellaceae bacterium]|nr:hypothetical protein [Smithellaceae bacterium]
MAHKDTNLSSLKYLLISFSLVRFRNQGKTSGSFLMFYAFPGKKIS